jgi:hypothetical protein
MKAFYFLTLLAGCLFMGNLCAQSNRVDTTLKIGKVGYRVVCPNKNFEQNELHVKPIGFDKDAREMGFYIKGFLRNELIDDLNNDGFPDLVLYVYTGPHYEFGGVYVFASQENKAMVPFVLPDPMLDGKLKDGYKGHDDFTLIEGKLMREYPIYLSSDSTDKPTGGKRFVRYNVVSNARGFEFKVQSTNDVK